MVDVAARIPIRKMFDRGWPDYTYPAADHGELQAPAFLRYREWLRQGGVQGERLRPGRADQIVLVKDAKGRFPGNGLWGDGWGWGLFLANDPAKNVATDYKVDCRTCHIPAKPDDWLYVRVYPGLKK